MKYTVKPWLKADCLHGWKWTVSTFCEDCHKDLRLIVYHPKSRKESTKNRFKRWKRLSKSGKIPGFKTETRKVTVCDKCLTASCWQGIFMCQENETAGTVQKTRTELRKLNLENPCYWKTDKQLS